MLPIFDDDKKDYEKMEIIGLTSEDMKKLLVKEVEAMYKKTDLKKNED